MKKKRKMILCGVMTLVMALVMAMPISASAAAKTVTTGEALTVAINNAEDGDTIILGADITQSITIAEDQNITLDLGGYTLTNTAGSHTITNNGTLTIIGNGTVDNVTHAKAALVNYGEATLEGGTFTRSKEASKSPTDNGGNSYYVIDNQGDMTIKDGVTVINKGYYSSLIRNIGSSATDMATLTIEGGTLEQQGFIAVKNDDYGELDIIGGTITSGEQTVQNWSSAEINGGTLNGSVITWSYTDRQSGESLSETRIISGNINGNVIAVNYDGSNNIPEVIIEGGMITGELQKGTYNNGIVISEPTATTASIVVTGGTFTTAPTDFTEEGMVVVKYTKSGESSTYYVGTEEEINDIISGASSGDEIIVLAGDIDMQIEDEGVKITNNGNGNVTANGITLEEGDGITTAVTTPSDNTETTTPADETTAASNDKAVATGDDFNMTALLAIMGIAAAAAAGTVVYGRRKRSN